MRLPLGPRVTVVVTPEIINTSTRAHSSHCMIADAIKMAVPNATRVAVDISTCRFTDPTKGLRYVYLTPRVAQEALVDFDEGSAVTPFSVTLKNAHVTKAAQKAERTAARARKKSAGLRENISKAVLVGSKKSDLVPRQVGGRRAPQLHIRREFGLRAFRAASLNRLIAEQPVHVVDDSSND